MFIRRQSQRRTPSMRQLRIALLFLCIALLFYGSILLWWYFHRVKIEWALDVIRAEGYPATPTELNAWYPEVFEQDNAALLYLQATLEYPMLSAEERFQLPAPVGCYVPEMLDQPYPEETQELSRQILMMNQDSLALLREAAQRPGCRFPVDFTQGYNAETEHLNHLRDNCYRLLSLAALEAAEVDDSETASYAFMDLLALIQHLENEPSIISQLARLRFFQGAFRDLSRILNRTSLNEDQLLSLQFAVIAIESQENFRQALAAERCLIVDVIYYYSQTNAPPFYRTNFDFIFSAIKGFIGLPPSPKLFMNYKHVLYTIEIMNQLIDLAGRPFPENIHGFKAISLDELPKILTNSIGVLLPAYKRALTQLAVFEAYRRCMLTALAIERYRITWGEPPVSLDDLVPEYLDAVPQDPFDGQPLRYRNDVLLYTIYSIGRNETDNGGLLPPPGTFSDPDMDIVFAVLR